MHRIDGPGAVEILPDPKESGAVSGFFDGGNPATGRMSTVVTSEWCNSIQEELAGVIEAGGVTLNKTDNTQLLLAIRSFIAELIPEGNFKPLSLGDIDFFNRKTPPRGYAVGNGAFLANADALYPALWAFLQEPENAWRLKTETEWQATIHEDGVGGANAFVLDAEAKTLRLPDIRGDYMAGAGWNEKAVGDCDGDAIRNIKSNNNTADLSGVPMGSTNNGVAVKAPFTRDATHPGFALSYTPSPSAGVRMGIDVSLSVPTDIRNHPTTIYTLPCVYVGVPVVGALLISK